MKRVGLGWTIPIVDADVRRRAIEIADRLKEPSGFGSFGLEESDLERREAWLMRAGLRMPAWCANDPRIDAATACVCAALDSLVDDEGIVLAREFVIAELLRLLPSELGPRLTAPLARLASLGIATPVRTGGYLLIRTHVEAPAEPDEWSDEALAEWARSLPPEQAKIASETLAKVIENLRGAL